MQKTAYERRISVWSSDMCSSDLSLPVDIAGRRCRCLHSPGTCLLYRRPRDAVERTLCSRREDDSPFAVQPHLDAARLGKIYQDPARSEEHTSELQSLMRISYAVFCLKTKTTTKKTHKKVHNQQQHQD